MWIWNKFLSLSISISSLDRGWRGYLLPGCVYTVGKKIFFLITFISSEKTSSKSFFLLIDCYWIYYHLKKFHGIKKERKKTFLIKWAGFSLENNFYIFFFFDRQLKQMPTPPFHVNLKFKWEKISRSQKKKMCRLQRKKKVRNIIWGAKSDKRKIIYEYFFSC